MFKNNVQTSEEQAGPDSPSMPALEIPSIQNKKVIWTLEKPSEKAEPASNPLRRQNAVARQLFFGSVPTDQPANAQLNLGSMLQRTNSNGR
jgi:hypothetical protein